MKKYFLFNADYDFRLAAGEISPKIERGVDSMAPLFMPALDSNDSLFSRVDVSGFGEYLSANGISSATIIPFNTPVEGVGVPWGVSDAALDIFQRHTLTYSGPTAEICTLVNSRSTASTIHKKHCFGVPSSQVINNWDDFLAWVNMNAGYKQLVLKPEFGNAGSGFVRVALEDIAKKKSAIQELLKKGACIVEPWLERTADLASLFEIASDGKISILGHHRNICNSAGSFYGTVIAENDELLVQYRDQLERAVAIVGKELYNLGYWGIVSIDSFAYQIETSVDIALAIDINARYTMSYIAHMIKKKLRLKALFYRFIAKRRHELPESYEQIEEQLGDLVFQNGRGVILTSPVRIIEQSGCSVQPARSAFAVVGDSVDELFKMDEVLRERVLKTKI